MSRLEKRKEQNEKLSKAAQVRDETYSKENVLEDRNLMYKSLQSLSSVLDSTGEYRIVSFISTSDSLKNSKWKYSSISKLGTLDGTGSGNGLYRRNDISVVTHGTVLQLHHLALLSQRWHGLISVSVFVDSIQQLPIAVETILLLRHCIAPIRHRTSFHLVYPLSLSARLSNRQARSVLDFLKWPDILESYADLEHLVSDQNCASMNTALERWTESTMNYNHKVPYPSNLLRNIARRHGLTEYSFVLDIDLVPSSNLYESFLEFGKRTKLFKEWDASLLGRSTLPESKVIFVVPTYEMDLTQLIGQRTGKQGGKSESEMIPRDKAELIARIEQRLVRPFYIELCWKCQKWTDYEAWLHASRLINATSETRIDILFEVLWHDPWEPFYISANNVPLYDERFRQYGFNRISQVRISY